MPEVSKRGIGNITQKGKLKYVKYMYTTGNLLSSQCGHFSEDGEQVKRKEAAVLYVGKKKQSRAILAFHTRNHIFKREGSNLLA